MEIFDCRGSFPDKFEFLANNMIHIGAKLEQIREKIVDYKPELVGVTSLFDIQTKPVYSIFDLAKSIDRNIATVIGGNTASCYPEETLAQNKNIDVVVVGEGENTFRELLDCNADNLKDINGIVYRDSGNIVRNKPRKLIKDLDTIPFPRRDLLNIENCMNVTVASTWTRARVALKSRGLRHVLKAAFHVRTKAQSERRGREAKLLTSRGCPYTCYFCAVRNVWGCSYRMRSANNVLEEMQMLHDKYDVKHFGIVDDNFSVSKKRTMEICRGIVERGLDISLRADSGTYLASMDEEVLGWMKKAGFNELYFAIESGNAEVAKRIIGKNVNLQQAKDVAKTCRKLGITSGGFFILGIPGETKATMKETVRFAVDSGLDRVRLYTCQPYRGSQLYDDARKNGWITKDFDPSKSMVFESRSYLETEDFGPGDVYSIAEEGKKLLRQQNRLDG